MYTKPGTYQVALQAYNTGGFNRTRKIGYVTVTELHAPIANFTANVTSGTVPLTVQFNDTTNGSQNTLAWDFGDTSTSTEKNPLHIYSAIGTYTVNLTVTGPSGSNTTTKSNYITVHESPPIAEFSGTPQSGTVPQTVQFTDLSSNNPSGWAWYFGDESYIDPWTQMTANAEWSARIDSSSVLMPDNSIILMGGHEFGSSGSGYFNDIWRSIDDGATWTQITPSAEWPARWGHSSVVMPDSSIVLMGGYSVSQGI